MTVKEKQTEEKIFEAATDVFIRKGKDGARMKEIADLAGINKALLHYYFRTKERLFNAVFEQIAEVMLRKLAPVFDEKLPLEEKIRFFFREHIAFLQQNPGLPGFILNEVNRNPERIRKLMDNINPGALMSTLIGKHSEEMKNYNITENRLPQIMTSMAAMSIFPFAARSVLEVMFEKAGVDFNTYTEERKEFAADFVIKALKK